MQDFPLIELVLQKLRYLSVNIPRFMTQTIQTQTYRLSELLEWYSNKRYF